MVDIPINELRSMSYASIEGLMRRCSDELQRRRNEERERLIKEFKKVWLELKDAGICISYCEEFDSDTTYLEDWDGFDFN